MHPRLSPSRESFRELAHRGNLIPVYREIIADMETPVSAFHKIDTGDHSFLFESVEKGNKFARYSFLGASPHLIFQARGKNITLREGAEQRAYTIDRDPLHELEHLMAGSNGWMSLKTGSSRPGTARARRDSSSSILATASS